MSDYHRVGLPHLTTLTTMHPPAHKHTPSVNNNEQTAFGLNYNNNGDSECG